MRVYRDINYFLPGYYICPGKTYQHSPLTAPNQKAVRQLNETLNDLSDQGMSSISFNFYDKRNVLTEAYDFKFHQNTNIILSKIEPYQSQNIQTTHLFGGRTSCAIDESFSANTDMKT